MPAQPSRASARRPRLGMLIVRYGLGIVLVLAGIILLAVNPGGFGIDGFGMAAGSGLSVLMLNWLYRLGVRSDEERVEEEQARIYLAKHGRWPDEPPRAPRQNPPGRRAQT